MGSATFYQRIVSISSPTTLQRYFFNLRPDIHDSFATTLTMNNTIEQGITTQRSAIPTNIITKLSAVVAKYQRQNKATSIRHADLKIPAIKAFAQSALITEIASQYTIGRPQLVRAIVFDKNPEENWSVTWHQDKTIAVNKKCDIAGWGPWSIKEGVHHVQPDFALLNNCITLRCHLDNTDTDNGCLQVIPKSHTQIWTSEEIRKITAEPSAIDCEADAGDILIMRPQLLHASKKASSPSRRQIVHLEFCGSRLPEGLSFASS